MKRVAVITTSFNIEYSPNFLNGVCDYFQDKDVQLLIAQTKLPHEKEGLFEYQYWASMELLRSDDVDVLIIPTGVYCASKHFSLEDFKKYLKRNFKKPIVTVSVDLQLGNSYPVLLDCENAYMDVVTHLKKIHNCKKIGFVSADSTNSEEALNRHECFNRAMKANNLEINDKINIDGRFTHQEVEKAMDEIFKTREDFPFDALVCANDDMASGVIKSLSKLGLSVPQDVKVVGFDDAAIATFSRPKLSTISQKIYTLGFDAAKCAFNILSGKAEKKLTVFSKLSPKYRQSCGCIDVFNSDSIFYNEKNQLCHEPDNSDVYLSQFFNGIDEKNNIITLMDMVKGANSLRQLFYNLGFMSGLCEISEMCVYLYNEPVIADRDEEPDLHKPVELYMHVDNERKINSFRPGVFGDIQKGIFFTEKNEILSGNYIIQPLFAGESIYGYVTCRINGRKFTDYNIYLKIIVTTLAQAFDYTEKLAETEKLENQNTALQINNTALSKESKIDELTEVLNRRGFIFYGQRSLDLMQEMSTAGVILFADMDGLKKINDTYGHDMGDKAIKLQADSLKEVFRSSDVIGRIGGDEFGIVALGMTIDQIDIIRERLRKINTRISKENNLPFILSISIGGVDLESSSVLKKLLTEADKRMYLEKSQKHKNAL